MLTGKKEDLPEKSDLLQVNCLILVLFYSLGRPAPTESA